MLYTLKNRILFAVLVIVLMFTCFTLFYFPRQEREYLLKSYNEQVQNLANSVSLGVRIALNEDNYEGIKTAMEYVKGQPDLKYVSLVLTDSVWNDAHTQYTIKEKIFRTFPEDVQPSLSLGSNDSMIVKLSDFTTDLMSGAIVLALSTRSIVESQRRIRTAALVTSAIVLLVGMMIGLWLANSISRRVEVLSSAARKVGSGDLSAVVTNNSNDEIGSFIKVFNAMVNDLAAARREVDNANQNLSEANQALNKTLNDLKATQAQLIQSEKMASLGELTAGVAHEIQNPLNFVNNFSELNAEMVDEVLQEISKGNYDEAKFMLEDIKRNSAKINHHGKRADAIVKGMLQHSQASTAAKEPTDLNALCNEYLRLAYHGFRAKDKASNAAPIDINLKTAFDKTIGTTAVQPQDMGRALLNIINNAFYAVHAKSKIAGNDYQPVVKLATARLGDKIEISIKDNGPGIPENIKEKIFQPFFTTKPTGQGTGLGLSLSYDIVKTHGGELKLETVQSEGSCFIIQLPVA